MSATVRRLPPHIVLGAHATETQTTDHVRLALRNIAATDSKYATQLAVDLLRAAVEACLDDHPNRDQIARAALEATEGWGTP